MTLQEFRQQRQQEMLAERHVGIDPQPPARLGVGAGTAFGLFQIGQHPQAALIERAALRGQLQLAGGALQQARTQSLFQPRNQLADRRRRHLQAAGGGGKAAGFDHPHEYLQFAGSVDVGACHVNEFDSQMIVHAQSSSQITLDAP